MEVTYISWQSVGPGLDGWRLDGNENENLYSMDIVGITY